LITDNTHHGLLYRLGEADDSEFDEIVEGPLALQAACQARARSLDAVH